jgi:hypothetical protein
MGSIRELLDYILNVFKFWIIIQPWEQSVRTRFGKHKKILYAGIHFRIPFMDGFYIQCVRLRVANLSMQNLTTKDLKTVTLSGSIGYEILNIETLYSTMYEPESTISGIAMGAVADYVYSHESGHINMLDLENTVLKALDLNKYGINVSYYKLTNFAVVRTYRLIQDQSMIYRSEILNVSK